MPRGVKTARSIRRATTVKRELAVRQDGQHYGVVTSLMGNNRVLVNIIDDTNLVANLVANVVECPCTIRGSMRRREWIHVNDIVLVACREYDITKKTTCCDLAKKHVHDIIQRYTDDEVSQLKRFGELVIPEKPSDLSDHMGDVLSGHEVVFQDSDVDDI